MTPFVVWRRLRNAGWRSLGLATTREAGWAVSAAVPPDAIEEDSRCVILRGQYPWRMGRRAA